MIADEKRQSTEIYTFSTSNIYIQIDRYIDRYRQIDIYRYIQIYTYIYIYIYIYNMMCNVTKVLNS